MAEIYYFLHIVNFENLKIFFTYYFVDKQILSINLRTKIFFHLNN